MSRHFTLFCHAGDPAQALSFLEERGADPSAEPDGSWEVGFAFPEDASITIRYSAGYCSPPSWEQQLAGMANYVAGFELDEARRLRVCHTVLSFAFAVSCECEPPVSAGDDPRLGVVHELADHLGALIFVPGALLDSHFRAVAQAEGEPDPEAVLPDVGELPERLELPELPEPLLEPPEAEQVARRLYALLCVAARGLLHVNLSQGSEPAYRIGDLRRFVAELELAEELEPEEAALFDVPDGELDPQRALNACWRFEGVAVLAWALGLLELPDYQTVLEVDEAFAALSFLDAPVARSKLAGAELRASEELTAFAKQALACYWRLVDMRVNPRHLPNYPEVLEGIFAEAYGPFAWDWAELAEGDLAIEGAPIAKTDPGDFGRVKSIGMERHCAARWLQAGGLYSETDLST